MLSPSHLVAAGAVGTLREAGLVPTIPQRKERSDMDGPELLAARLLRASVADDVDAVSHLVVEIEDSGYAGIVATGLAQSYISELLKTTRRDSLLRALGARILEVTAVAEATKDNSA
jgi:hypothetical protein